MVITPKFMKQKGQTLIEGMVAIFIIVIGIIGSLVLALSAFSSSVESEEQVKATNFAREALEVVRNIRDTNYLKRVDDPDINFDTGLESSPNNYRARVLFDQNNNAWQLEILYNTSFDPRNCPVGKTCQLFRDESTGVFNHDENGIQTNFYRILELNNICRQYVTPGTFYFETDGQPCDDGYFKAGISVLVKVLWIENGQERSLTLEDHLLDWK